MPELIAALDRSYDHSPPLPVGEGRADDLAEHGRVHVTIFVQDYTIKELAAKGVLIVGAKKCDAGGGGIGSQSADLDV